MEGTEMMEGERERKRNHTWFAEINAEGEMCDGWWDVVSEIFGEWG